MQQIRQCDQGHKDNQHEVGDSTGNITRIFQEPAAVEQPVNAFFKDVPAIERDHWDRIEYTNVDIDPGTPEKQVYYTPEALEGDLVVDGVRCFECKDAEELDTGIICEGDYQELEKP